MSEVKDYLTKMQESVEKCKVQVRMALKNASEPTVFIIIVIPQTKEGRLGGGSYLSCIEVLCEVRFLAHLGSRRRRLA